jgi:hypothetical protein
MSDVTVATSKSVVYVIYTHCVSHTDLISAHSTYAAAVDAIIDYILVGRLHPTVAPITEWDAIYRKDVLTIQRWPLGDFDVLKEIATSIRVPKQCEIDFLRMLKTYSIFVKELVVEPSP